MAYSLDGMVQRWAVPESAGLEKSRSGLGEYRAGGKDDVGVCGWNAAAASWLSRDGRVLRPEELRECCFRKDREPRMSPRRCVRAPFNSVARAPRPRKKCILFSSITHLN